MAAGAGPELSSDDRLRLVELVHRYAHAVDEQRVDDIAALFARDARLEFASTGVVASGREEIRTFFRQVFARRASPGGTSSTHLMTNTVVEVGGSADEARLHTSAVAYLASSDDVVQRGLTYTDRCVREDGTWLLAERIHRLHWQATVPGGIVSSERPPV